MEVAEKPGSLESSAGEAGPVKRADCQVSESAPALSWEDVAASFVIDGSVKTVYIDAAGSMVIWQALMDWVGTRGPDCSYTETGTTGPAFPVPTAAEFRTALSAG